MLRTLQAHAASLPEAWRPERANQWTHALGFLLSLIAGTVMLSTVWQSRDAGQLWGCILYVAAMIALYAASTLSHSFEEGPYREFYRMLDQVCIFVFMAACFTPFALTHLRDAFGYGVLIVMWATALAGVVVRMRSRSRTFPIALFIPLGWLPMLVIARIFEVGHMSGLALVLAGGLAYTGGFWFLANDHKRGWYHAAWHLSTIAGTALHYFFLLEFVARHPDLPTALAVR
ncbi:MAG TPA: hemolysin III family protein [Caulifigura sp.]|jgi:hemolysin III|nr:hemolysin III family protein [Caulifigura sp.]